MIVGNVGRPAPGRRQAQGNAIHRPTPAHGAELIATLVVSCQLASLDALPKRSQGASSE